MRATLILLLLFQGSCKGQELKTWEPNSRIMTIDEILQLEDQTTAVIKLDERVNELSDYGEDLSKLTQPEKVLLFIGNLEREVNNGGFYQFYANSSGDYAHETYDALKTIGATKMADILDKANSIWPNRTVPKNGIKRQDVQDSIEEQAEKVWDQCDSNFYGYPDDIAGLLIKYVKQNKSDFK